MAATDASIQRDLRGVVRRHGLAGETLPIEYIRLCEEHGVSMEAPKPKKAPAKKKPRARK